MAEFEKLEELTVGLYDVGALRFSDFEFKVKPRLHETEPRPSPVYYNQRPLVSIDTELAVNGNRVSRATQGHVRALAVNAYANVLDEATDYDHLYGIPQAMTSLGAMVAYVRGNSILWGRVGQKDYGAHAAVEGNFQSGDSTYDLDDVLTSAGSKIESAESKAKVGLRTVGFAVMLNREEGGAEALAQTDFELLSIQGLGRAMDMLRTNKRIGQQEFDWVDQYHEGLRTDGLI